MTTPSDALDHHEAKLIAKNILHNDGVSADTAKYALDILNGQLKTLARAYLSVADKPLRTAGTVEVCVHHDDGACMNPLRQTTNNCPHLQCPLKSTK